MRDEFVGILVVSGIFLITYKIFKIKAGLENALSTLAGIAAIVVAIFPTGDSTVPLTPLQDKLGEDAVEVIHFTSAATFILMLAGISVCFGKREGRRPPRQGQRYTPRQWERFHYACASLIVAAMTFIAVTKVFDVFDRYRILIGETAALLAFG